MGVDYEVTSEMYIGVSQRKGRRNIQVADETASAKAKRETLWHEYVKKNFDELYWGGG